MVYICMYVPIWDNILNTKVFTCYNSLHASQSFCRVPIAFCNRMSILIWIQTVWHTDGGPGWFIFKNLILKKVSRRKKNEHFPSMQIDKYRTFAK